MTTLEKRVDIIRSALVSANKRLRGSGVIFLDISVSSSARSLPLPYSRVGSLRSHPGGL